MKILKTFAGHDFKSRTSYGVRKSAILDFRRKLAKYNII